MNRVDVLEANIAAQQEELAALRSREAVESRAQIAAQHLKSLREGVRQNEERLKNFDSKIQEAFDALVVACEMRQEHTIGSYAGPEVTSITEGPSQTLIGLIMGKFRMEKTAAAAKRTLQAAEATAPMPPLKKK